jgi:hypothetical protein
MLRLLLLRFLPRRLLPILLLYEAYKFVTRGRRRAEPVAGDERTVEGRAQVVHPRSVDPRG